MSRPRPALASQHGTRDLQVARLVAALRDRPAAPRGTAKSAGSSVAPLHLPVADFERQRGPGGGDFVQAVGAVDHEAALAAPAPPARRPSVRAAFARGRAHQLRVGAGRIGQRAQQVENGAHLEIARAPAARASWRCGRAGANRKPMPTSRMARAASAGGSAMSMPSASSRSALPHWLDMRPVAVLGHAHARARHHERRHGRNVEGAGAVAAGAAGIEQRLAVERRRRPARPSRAWRARSPPARPRSRPSSAGPSETRRSAAGWPGRPGSCAWRPCASADVRSSPLGDPFQVRQKGHDILKCLAFSPY